MSRELLTVDLGNTRCKLCSWDRTNDAAPLESVAFQVDDRLVRNAQSWLADRKPVEAGAGSAVAGRALSEDLASALASTIESGGGRWFSPPHGLTVECEQPESIGEDRLFAARGALELLGRTCIVVDAGTAVTVDLLRVEGSRGVFAGGAIAPGPDLLARALAQGAVRLPKVAPRPGAPALGRNTRAAIESGVAVGFKGAVRELVHELGRGFSQPPEVVITGGASPFLTDDAFVVEPLREPWLVHRGLLAALRLQLR